MSLSELQGRRIKVTLQEIRNVNLFWSGYPLARPGLDTSLVADAASRVSVNGLLKALDLSNGVQAMVTPSYSVMASVGSFFTVNLTGLAGAGKSFLTFFPFCEI